MNFLLGTAPSLSVESLFSSSTPKTLQAYHSHLVSTLSQPSKSFPSSSSLLKSCLWLSVFHICCNLNDLQAVHNVTCGILPCGHHYHSHPTLFPHLLCKLLCIFSPLCFCSPGCNSVKYCDNVLHLLCLHLCWGFLFGPLLGYHCCLLHLLQAHFIYHLTHSLLIIFDIPR